METQIEVSSTHYLIIDCPPGKIRPNNILENILYQLEPNNKLTINDFIKVSCFCGEWKFMLYKNKETEYEKQLIKIIHILEILYKNGTIRYAEYEPNI
jgi:hypothetical protein